MREKLGEVEEIRKNGKETSVKIILEFCTSSQFTCCSGVFQRVCCTDGVSSLGGTSHSSLVNGTNPELVQASFLESKYWVVAHFLNVHIAAHPLALTHVISGKELTKERRGYKKKVIDLVKGQRRKFTFEALHVQSAGCNRCKAFQLLNNASEMVNTPLRPVTAPR